MKCTCGPQQGCTECYVDTKTVQAQMLPTLEFLKKTAQQVEANIEVNKKRLHEWQTNLEVAIEEDLTRLASLHKTIVFLEQQAEPAPGIITYLCLKCNSTTCSHAKEKFNLFYEAANGRPTV